MADPDDFSQETILPPYVEAPLLGGARESPYNFYFTSEDSLRLTVWNSRTGVSIAVNYRIHRPGERPVASRFTVVVPNDRLAFVMETTIGEGFLLNVSAHASAGAPRIGHTFVQLQVIRGRGAASTIQWTILQGYVTGSQHVTWPGSQVVDSSNFVGVIRQLSGTQPPVTTEVNETCPPGVRWILVSMNVPLTTVAGGSNRRPILGSAVNGITAFMSPHTNTVAPASSVLFHWTIGMTIDRVISTVYQSAALPSQPTLWADDTLFTATEGLQVGDRYGVPTYIVLEWLEAK